MTPSRSLQDPLPMSPSAVRQLADAELSGTGRFAHVALLLVSLLMTVAVGSLWVTEPALPLRTHVAFAGLIAIGAAWAAYAAWVLTRKRPLLARHRVAAGVMAVTFTGTFAAGSTVLAMASGRTAAAAAAVAGTAMCGAALALLLRARRERARLILRRDELARELGRRA